MVAYAAAVQPHRVGYLLVSQPELIGQRLGCAQHGIWSAAEQGAVLPVGFVEAGQPVSGQLCDIAFVAAGQPGAAGQSAGQAPVLQQLQAMGGCCRGFQGQLAGLQFKLQPLVIQFGIHQRMAMQQLSSFQVVTGFFVVHLGNGALLISPLSGQYIVIGCDRQVIDGIDGTAISFGECVTMVDAIGYDQEITVASFQAIAVDTFAATSVGVSEYNWPQAPTSAPRYANCESELFELTPVDGTLQGVTVPNEATSFSKVKSLF